MIADSYAGLVFKPLSVIPDLSVTNIYSQEDDNWTIDIENYNCKKLDMGKPEDKALWTKYIAGEMDDFGGKEFEKDHIF